MPEIETSSPGIRIVTRVRHYLVLVFLGHIALIAAWLVGSTIYPPLGEGIANVLGPLGRVTEMIYPVVGNFMHGTMSINFYRAFVSEVFIVALILVILTILGFLSRGLTDPCLLIETVAAKNKASVFSAKITLFVVILDGVTALARFVLPVWFGAVQLTPEKPIFLHQLGLWAIVTPASCVIVLFSIFLTISYLAYLLRSAFLLISEK